MPIVGMTVLPDGEGIAKMPRIAKMRKGAEKEIREKNGREYEVVGKDLDHFRIVFEPEFEYLRPMWEELYGTEPTEFANVWLAGATVDEAFPNWREEWKAATMMRRCDGMHLVTFYNTDTHVYISDPSFPCASPVDPQTGVRPANCACKPTASLRLIFREFIGMTGVMGYVEAYTTSVNDIMAVAAYLTFIQFTYGTLLKVPFLFGRAEKEINTPMTEGRGKDTVTVGRAKRPKSLFYIHVMPDYVRSDILPAMVQAPALPATVEPPKMSAEEAKAKLGSGKGSEKFLGGGNGNGNDKPALPSVTVRTAVEDAWKDRTAHLFDDPASQAEIFDRMWNEGALQPSMTVEEAVAAVKTFITPPVNTWINDAATVAKFMDEANKRYKMDTPKVTRALRAADKNRPNGIMEWQGDKTSAWAAVVAFGIKYDIEEADKIEGELGVLVRAICHEQLPV